jgi:hypothetical protein
MAVVTLPVGMAGMRTVGMAAAGIAARLWVCAYPGARPSDPFRL